jgi:hypothetical protein
MLAGSSPELFDLGGGGGGFDVSQAQPALVTAVEELLYRARLRHAGEFDETAAGMYALSANNRWRRLEFRADQRRRQYDLLGQQDRRLRHSAGCHCPC